MASWLARTPTARGILVGGSFARGAASLVSDLDLCVFVDDGHDAEHYRTWLENRTGAPALHVTARTDMTLDVWAEDCRGAPELGLRVAPAYRPA